MEIAAALRGGNAAPRGGLHGRYVAGVAACACETRALAATDLRGLGLEVVEELVPVDAWRLVDAHVEAGRRCYERASLGAPETE